MSKKIISCTIDEELLRRAKALNINRSEACEYRLRQLLEKHDKGQAARDRVKSANEFRERYNRGDDIRELDLSYQKKKKLLEERAAAVAQNEVNIQKGIEEEKTAFPARQRQRAIDAADKAARRPTKKELAVKLDRDRRAGNRWNWRHPDQKKVYEQEGK